VPYQVRFTDDSGLPADTDWVIARRGGVSYLFVKESRLSPELLAEAWAAWENRECDYSIASSSLAAVNA
jgi:hypothetical protein